MWLVLFSQNGRNVTNKIFLAYGTFFGRFLKNTPKPIYSPCQFSKLSFSIPLANFAKSSTSSENIPSLALRLSHAHGNGGWPMKFSWHLPTSFSAMPEKILGIWTRFQKSGQSLNRTEVSIFYQMVKKHLILQNW